MGVAVTGGKAWRPVGLEGEDGEGLGGILEPQYVQGRGGYVIITDGAGAASLLKRGARPKESGEGAGGYVEGAGHGDIDGPVSSGEGAGEEVGGDAESVPLR